MNYPTWRLILSLVLGLELVLVSCSAARPLTHRAAAIHGRIVDAETGEPVADAIVAAVWKIWRTAPHTRLRYSQRLHILEAETDATGAYTIPAWGPKLLPLGAEVSEYTPQLRIFKRGYRPQFVRNDPIGRAHIVPESDWDGKVIELERPQGPLRDQLGALQGAYMELSPGIEPGTPGDWRNYPRATLEAYAEARRLQVLGVNPRLGLGVVDIERLDKVDREFLRRFE